MDAIKVWGIKYNLVTVEDIVNYVESRIANGEKGIHLTGANAETVMLARKDELLRRAIMESDVVNVDSFLPAFYLKLSGYKIKKRVPTPDVMDALFESASINRRSIYLLGAKQSTLDCLIPLLSNQYPGLKIAGSHNGYFIDEKIDTIVSEIHNLSPDYLFIALPSPRKEQFILKYKHTLNVGCLYGVGGAFDAKSGVLPRPPKWADNYGLEGIFRLIRNPRQYGRRFLRPIHFMLWAPFHFFLAILAMLAVSCMKDAQDESMISEGVVTQITAELADGQTKTVLGEDGTSVLWSPNDEISVFYNTVSVKFTSLNTEPLERTIFASEKALFYNSTESAAGKEEPWFWGVYPYDAANKSDGESVTMTVPALQTAVAGSFGKDSFAAIGRSRDTKIAFYNVCGGIRFTLTQSGIRKIDIKGNDNENLAGKVKVAFDESGLPEVNDVIDGATTVSLTAPDSGEFEVGKWYYVSLLPVKFSDGFTIKFYKGIHHDIIGEKSVASAQEVKRSVFASVNKIDCSVIISDVGDLSCNYVNFEDEIFRRFCIDNYDLDSDGRVSYQEASLPKSMNVSNFGIKSLAVT